jgi:hypothetical protein
VTDEEQAVISAAHELLMRYAGTPGTEELERAMRILEQSRAETVLGWCVHGVNLDIDICPKGCRV